MKQQQLVLTLNAGSSSVKASLMEGELRLVTFLAEALGTADSVLHINNDQGGSHEIREAAMSYEQVFNYIVNHLRELDILQHIVAVGHRVVHGSIFFHNAVIVDHEVLNRLDSIEHLAPL
jgi:acetate kinase